MYYMSTGQCKLCPDYTLPYAKTFLWLKKRKDNPKGDLTANLIHFPTYPLVKKQSGKAFGKTPFVRTQPKCKLAQGRPFGLPSHLWHNSSKASTNIIKWERKFQKGIPNQLSRLTLLFNVFPQLIGPNIWRLKEIQPFRQTPNSTKMWP